MPREAAPLWRPRHMSTGALGKQVLWPFLTVSLAARPRASAVAQEPRRPSWTCAVRALGVPLAGELWVCSPSHWGADPCL